LEPVALGKIAGNIGFVDHERGSVEKGFQAQD
jgi:hypothetical protein